MLYSLKMFQKTVFSLFHFIKQFSNACLSNISISSTLKICLFSDIFTSRLSEIQRFLNLYMILSLEILSQTTSSHLCNMRTVVGFFNMSWRHKFTVSATYSFTVLLLKYHIQCHPALAIVKLCPEE